MNCTSRLSPHFRERTDQTALWTVPDGRVSFGEFAKLAATAQAVSRAEGLTPGDTALVLAPPGPLLFASVVGLMGMGITVVFVEPWLPLRDVEHVLRYIRPKAFLGSRLAQLWALRLSAARDIPRWIHLNRIARETGVGVFHCADLDPGTPGTITFTSGTSGRPKGLVRSHECLWHLHEAVTDSGRSDRYDAPELCIFPNLGMLHLGTGRGAVLVPPDWSPRSLRRVAALSAASPPASLACGPAFLRRLLRFTDGQNTFGGLRSITVGGAQTDCQILEKAFQRWPDAQWTHVYGGSEAEPVAITDARESVRRSRARGHFQALFVGAPVDSIMVEPKPDGLWVSGRNVATYCSGMSGDASARRVDEFGREWHCMGDRVVPDEYGLWYQGRTSQRLEEFELEQRVYSDLGTSACFVHRDRTHALILYGEVRTGRYGSDTAILRAHPELDGVRHTRIVRDRRHRARIDRRATLVRGGYDEA